MSWRVAKSLEKLLAQVNAAAPGRSKASDGAIGDVAHAASISDHNPDHAGVVRARDFTHDPKHGLVAAELGESLRVGRDNRVKYVICNRKIMAGNCGPKPWIWRPYSGADPHTNHLHLSVATGSLGDNPRDWVLKPTKEIDMPLTEAEMDRIAYKVWAYDQKGAKDQAWGFLQRAAVNDTAGIAAAVALRIPAGAPVTQAAIESALKTVLGSIPGVS